MGKEVLRMENITKTFPGVLANDRISVDLMEGEIHALLGENGAGKTTLMNILYGLYRADDGKIFLNGGEVVIDSPKRAIELGIGMVHQHFMLIPPLTVMENIVLGHEPNKNGMIDLAQAEKDVSELSQRFGLYVSPRAKVESITVGMQQRVEILKALYRQVKILILDEPTAVLTPQEVEELFSVIKSLTERGLSIFFITHKLEEVMAISDRVTVIRGGRVVDTVPTAETDMVSLARMMVGREVVLRVNREKMKAGKTILKVSNLHVLDNRRLPAVREVSFEVKEGEIVGIAGVDGNGQTELEEALTGLRKVESGQVFFSGEDISNLSKRERIKKGLSHVPQDRHKMGLIMDFTVAENLILGDQREKPYANGPVLNLATIREKARALIKKFDIRCPHEQLPARSLSGGNQQKLVVAREFKREPRLLIAAQPTRGLDVGATEFVHNQLLEFRRRGKGVLLISLELEEIMSLSDRILVIYEGEITAEFPSEGATREEIGFYMTGGGKKKIALNQA